MPDDAASDPPPAGEQRLQKVLARVGLGSRRACEELIAHGFTIHCEHERAGLRLGDERSGQGNVKALPIDPGNVVADFFDQDPPAVVLFLSPPVRVLDELRGLV